jgi:hypothetical protein
MQDHKKFRMWQLNCLMRCTRVLTKVRGKYCGQAILVIDLAGFEWGGKSVCARCISKSKTPCGVLLFTAVRLVAVFPWLLFVAPTALHHLRLPAVVAVVDCCCWLLLLIAVVGCCCWLLLLVAVVGCCCCWLLLLVSVAVVAAVVVIVVVVVVMVVVAVAVVVVVAMVVVGE